VAFRVAEAALISGGGDSTNGIGGGGEHQHLTRPCFPSRESSTIRAASRGRSTTRLGRGYGRTRRWCFRSWQPRASLAVPYPLVQDNRAGCRQTVAEECQGPPPPLPRASRQKRGPTTPPSEQPANQAGPPRRRKKMMREIRVDETGRLVTSESPCVCVGRTNRKPQLRGCVRQTKNPQAPKTDKMPNRHRRAPIDTIPHESTRRRTHQSTHA